MSASFAASLMQRILVIAAASCCLTASAIGQVAPVKVEPSSSLLGSYMAGRTARAHHDSTAAVQFYRQALDRAPFDPEVVENNFLVEAAEGNFERATALARRVVENQPMHRIANIWLATAAVKERNFPVANELLAKSGGGGPIGELTVTLARSWLRLAEGNSAGAVELLRNFRIAEAAQNYVRFHRALLSDLAGRRADAAREFEAVFRQDPRTPRLALAYAQHAASSGDLKLARSVLKDHVDKVSGETQPMIRALQSQLQGNEVIRLMIESPEQGYAEVFYGLGEALASEGGVSLATIYLRSR